MFDSVGTTELLVILLVILLVFDVGQLPKIARSLGKAWKDFQKTTRSAQDEMRKMMEDDDENLRG